MIWIKESKLILQVPTDKCNLCDYVTIGKYTLITHMKKHNRKIVITKCDLCDFESASQVSYMGIQLT